MKLEEKTRNEESGLTGLIIFILGLFISLLRKFIMNDWATSIPEYEPFGIWFSINYLIEPLIYSFLMILTYDFLKHVEEHDALA